MIRHMKQGFMEGIRLFFWTFAFFYRHLSLVILSLVPSLFRVMQSWNQFQTPIWMEVMVEISRVVLFFLMIAIMMNRSVKDLFQRKFWESVQKNFDITIRHHWPHVIIFQILIFIICLYWLMNSLFEFLLNKATVQIIMSLIHIEEYDDLTARDSLLFFLKNMSIIPMSMVYLLRMFGIGKMNHSHK